MIQKEIQAIGQQAIQQIANQHRSSTNIHFRASTTPTRDSSLLQVFIANNDGTDEKVYNWGTLSFNDDQLTAMNLQQILETFVDRCVTEFWSKKTYDPAILAIWRTRSGFR